MKIGTYMVADDYKKLKEAIDFLKNTEVMVGIPAKNAARPGSPISNAEIGYVLEHGEPAHNLPPRPFLAPGVNSIRPAIEDSLSNAARAALAGDKNGTRMILNKIGLRAVNSVRATIDAQGFVPLAPATVERRFQKLNKRAQAQWIKELKSGATTLAEIASGATGFIKILIDTGSMRNAITYVLRYKGKDI